MYYVPVTSWTMPMYTTCYGLSLAMFSLDVEEAIILRVGYVLLGALLTFLTNRFLLPNTAKREFERNNGSMINIDNQEVILNINDAEITTDDIPGWTVTTQDNITVALDMTITKELADEGLAREIVNRIQGMRKDKGLEVTDHIVLTIEKNNDIVNAVEQYTDYICSETLATLNLVDSINDENVTKQELVENIYAKISISKA